MKETLRELKTNQTNRVKLCTGLSLNPIFVESYRTVANGVKLPQKPANDSAILLRQSFAGRYFSVEYQLSQRWLLLEVTGIRQKRIISLPLARWQNGLWPSVMFASLNVHLSLYRLHRRYCIFSDRWKTHSFTDLCSLKTHHEEEKEPKISTISGMAEMRKKSVFCVVSLLHMTQKRAKMRGLLPSVNILKVTFSR